MSIRMNCPACGLTQDETNFNISASAIFEVSKYGTEDFTAVEWDDDSAMQCRNCGHLGKVREFMRREEADA